jgi:hypothetical protein
LLDGLVAFEFLWVVAVVTSAAQLAADVDDVVVLVVDDAGAGAGVVGVASDVMDAEGEFEVVRNLKAVDSAGCQICSLEAGLVFFGWVHQ